MLRNIGIQMAVALGGLAIIIVSYRLGYDGRKVLAGCGGIFCAWMTARTIVMGHYPVFLTIGFWTWRYRVARDLHPRRYWAGVVVGIVATTACMAAAFGLIR